MAEICNAVSILQLTLRKNNSMDGASQQSVGPVAEEVADVDEDGGRGVVLCSRWLDGDGCPLRGWRLDLESWLAWELEEKCDATVVGVGAGADVN
jgi:hypothetical protein